jgi:sulfatase maturation enzyme AslB (radical SAM superfamily)
MNDYFCVLPFFGYEYSPRGRESHCCLLPEDYNIDSIRNSILAKERSPYCNACWAQEDRGLISDRKLKNSAFDFYTDKDIRYVEEDVRRGKYKTTMIKTRISNTCNSTCVTCNSGASSAWAPLEKKIGLVPAASESMTREQIDKMLDFKELISLNLIGGEPLYEKLNFYILEKLLEHGNDKCFIQITTNGSVIVSESRKELLKKFKNVNINLSIDGVGKVFEYMRFPLKWNDLLENLVFFKTLTENVSVSHTTSNLNVLYHHDTIEWFKKNNLNYHFNPVIDPSYFRPSALPIAIKEEIFKKQGRTPDLKYFIGSEHTTKDDKDFTNMLAVIKDQDRVKEISIIDYLPEFCQMIGFTS